VTPESGPRTWTPPSTTISDPSKSTFYRTLLLTTHRTMLPQNRDRIASCDQRCDVTSHYVH